MLISFKSCNKSYEQSSILHMRKHMQRSFPWGQSFLWDKNSYTTEFTILNILKCTIQCFLVYSQFCGTPLLSNSRTLSSLSLSLMHIHTHTNPYPLSIIPNLLNLPGPKQPLIYFVSTVLPTLNISYKWKICIYIDR